MCKTACKLFMEIQFVSNVHCVWYTSGPNFSESNSNSNSQSKKVALSEFITKWQRALEQRTAHTKTVVDNYKVSLESTAVALDCWNSRIRIQESFLIKHSSHRVQHRMGKNVLMPLQWRIVGTRRPKGKFII